MTIHELSLQIKRVTERLNSKEICTVLLILVTGFGSFALGRLSKLQESKSPIRLEQAVAAMVSVSSSDKGHAPTENGVLAPGGELVASRSGSKYHFPWCSGAQRISEGNKIWFSSVEEARKAGYTPASNCKGLK